MESRRLYASALNQQRKLAADNFAATESRTVKYGHTSRFDLFVLLVEGSVANTGPCGTKAKLAQK